MIRKYIDSFNKNQKLVKLKHSIHLNNLDKPTLGLHLKYLKHYNKSVLNLFEKDADLFQKKSTLSDLYIVCCTELYLYGLYHDELETSLVTMVGEVVERRYAWDGDNVKDFYLNEFRNYKNSLDSFKIKRYDVVGTMSVLLAYSIELDILDDIVEI